MHVSLMHRVLLMLLLHANIEDLHFSCGVEPLYESVWTEFSH